MNFSASCVKNVELAQVLMIKNESLFTIICMLGVGLEGERDELPNK